MALRHPRDGAMVPFRIDYVVGYRVAKHTRHRPGAPGSYCYDCHMSRRIVNLASGTSDWTRTHTMSHAPDPRLTLRFGASGSPNACNECHADRSAAWAAERVEAWSTSRIAGRSFLTDEFLAP